MYFTTETMKGNKMKNKRPVRKTDEKKLVPPNTKAMIIRGIGAEIVEIMQNWVNPRTVGEIHVHYKNIHPDTTRSRNELAKRVSELQKKGVIKWEGSRICGVTGRQAAMLVVVKGNWSIVPSKNGPRNVADWSSKLAESTDLGRRMVDDRGLAVDLPGRMATLDVARIGPAKTTTARIDLLEQMAGGLFDKSDNPSVRFPLVKNDRVFGDTPPAEALGMGDCMREAVQAQLTTDLVDCAETMLKLHPLMSLLAYLATRWYVPKSWRGRFNEYRTSLVSLSAFFGRAVIDYTTPQ